MPEYTISVYGWEEEEKNVVRYKKYTSRASNSAEAIMNVLNEIDDDMYIEGIDIELIHSDIIDLTEDI